MPHIDLDTTVTVIQLVLALGGLVAMIAALLRYTAKKLEAFVAREIAEATRPIHPDTNGGKSLADVARGLDRIEQRQGDIAEKVQRIDVAVEEEISHRRELERVLLLQGIHPPKESA